MRRPRVVLVPRDMALVYDGTGWTLGEVPPQWWIDMTEPEIADVIGELPPVAIATQRSNCRPGHGPCRRQHEHASGRRAA